MELGFIIQTILNGIVASCIDAVIAIGLALGFGVMQMANLAHGELFMLGAYVVYALYALGGVPFPLAVIAAFFIVGIVGIIVERTIFKPTREDVLAGFMATAGLMFVLQVIAGKIWGFGLMRYIETPYMTNVNIMGAEIGVQRLLIIPCAIVTCGGLRLFLQKARLGKALRACAQDYEAASIQGINIDKITILSMALAGGFAGVAGALLAPIHAVTPYMGHNVIIMAFIVVIVGGMESIDGAMIAAVILGFIHTIATTMFDAVIGTMVGVMVMVIVLVLKPEGIKGRA